MIYVFMLWMILVDLLLIMFGWAAASNFFYTPPKYRDVGDLVGAGLFACLILWSVPLLSQLHLTTVN